MGLHGPEALHEQLISSKKVLGKNEVTSAVNGTLFSVSIGKQPDFFLCVELINFK